MLGHLEKAEMLRETWVNEQHVSKWGHWSAASSSLFLYPRVVSLDPEKRAHESNFSMDSAAFPPLMC